MRAACETNLPESVWYVTRQQLAGLHENVECLLTCSMLYRGEERINRILSKRRVVEVQQSHLYGAKLRLGQSQHTSVLVATAPAPGPAPGPASTARTSRPSHPLHAPCMCHSRYTCVTDHWRWRRTIHHEWSCTKVFRAYNVSRG